MSNTSSEGNIRSQAPIRPNMHDSLEPGKCDELAGDSVSEIGVDAYRAIEQRRRKKRRKRIIIGVAAAVVLLAVLMGSALMGIQGQQETDIEQVPTGFIAQSDFEASVSASGSVLPISQVVVSPEVDGIVESVLVSEGDMVAQGDVLLTIKNDSLDKAVTEAEQVVRQAENGISAAERGLQSAENAYAMALSNYNSVFSRTYETQEEADAAGNEAVSALDSAQQGVDSANLELDNARLALDKAQENLDDARQNASKRTVRAPSSGAVVAMNAKVGAAIGQTVGSNSGESTTGALMTIADLSQMRVTVQVNEVDINKVSVGQNAEVTFSSIDDLTLEAQVQHIAALATGTNDMNVAVGGGIVTYDVELIIPVPDPRVKPGMTARVKIVSEKLEDVLTVPVAALTNENGDTATVAVVVDGDPMNTEERSVRILAQDSTTAAIEGDLVDGDEVLLSASAEDGEESAWEVSVG